MGRGDLGHLWIAGVQLVLVCPHWAGSPGWSRRCPLRREGESKEAGIRVNLVLLEDSPRPCPEPRIQSQGHTIGDNIESSTVSGRQTLSASHPHTAGHAQTHKHPSPSLTQSRTCRHPRSHKHGPVRAGRLSVCARDPRPRGPQLAGGSAGLRSERSSSLTGLNHRLTL